MGSTKVRQQNLLDHTDTHANKLAYHSYSANLVFKMKFSGTVIPVILAFMLIGGDNVEGGNIFMWMHLGSKSHMVINFIVVVR